MILYDYKEHEKYLIKWYIELTSTGEFDLVFHSSLGNVTEFLSHFKNRDQVGLVIEIRDEEIISAVWIAPLLDYMSVGLWTHKKYRYSREVISEMVRALGKAVQGYNLIGLCHQPGLDRFISHLGAVKLTTLPKMSDGKDVNVWILTKENFRGQRFIVDQQ